MWRPQVTPSGGDPRAPARPVPEVNSTPIGKQPYRVTKESPTRTVPQRSSGSDEPHLTESSQLVTVRDRYSVLADFGAGERVTGIETELQAGLALGFPGRES